jgi:hypothetical protein
MGGRHLALLYAPLWGLPVPMAVAPVAAFSMGALVLHSVPLGIAALVLGVSHVPLSLQRAAALRRGPSREADHTRPGQA